MGIKVWLANQIVSRMAKAFDESFWHELGAGRMSAAGMPVNWETALRTPTALRAGMLISDGVSTVPCKLMRKDQVTGRRVEAVEHPLYDLMANMPCSWMTSQQLRETLMLHTVFTGNGFAFVNRLSRGRITELWPFQKGEVTIERSTDPRDRAPAYRVNGEEVPSNRILHLRGPSWNGANGLDMVALAREVIGLSEATQDAHSKRFANGVESSGLFSVEGALGEAKHKRLTAWIEKHYTGRRNSGKPLLLDQKAAFTPFSISGVDAEHLATRQYQDILIARHLGVLPMMVGIADKTATYASAEQMFLAHCVHTIRPWHERIAQILNCFLLTAQERAEGYYFRFVDTALLRGAAKDRAEFYSKIFQVAGLTPNQILAFEDMDGFEGGDGHYIPSNLAQVLADGSLRSAAKPAATQSQR